jgi:hypothetical protein
MRASMPFLAFATILAATAAADAQGRHGPGVPGAGRPNSPESGVPLRPICPPVKCPGPGINPCRPYPWPCIPSKPHCRPPKYCGNRPTCGIYKGNSCGTWRPPFTMYPPLYVDGPYDTSAFTSWLAGWGAALPYYDSEPVQYAYTPIDIPPRATVVRPDRSSTFTRILPRQARRPLYELVLTQRPPAGHE